MGLRSRKYVIGSTDITDDVMDDSLMVYRRDPSEMRFRITEYAVLKHRGIIIKGATLTVTLDGTQRFSGPIKEIVIEDTDEGIFYDITARSAEVNIAKRTAGNRTYTDVNIAEPLVGWATDATFSDSPASTGTISLVSDNAGDTQSATITGVNANGFYINEDVTLAGTTPVTSSNSYSDVYTVELASAAVGEITISDSDSNTIGTINPELTTTLNMYQDAVVSGFGTVYSTVHSTPDSVNAAYTYLQIGQTATDVVGTTYYLIGRGFLSTALPSGITISQAVLKTTGNRNNSTTDFVMKVRESTAGQTITTGDYAEYGDTDFGEVNSSAYSETADAITITLNAAGLAYLNSKIGGYADLCLISEEDLNSSEPTDDEYWRLCSSEHATEANRPHLTITYKYSADQSDISHSETDGTNTNYSNGLLYGTGYYASFSDTPDFTIDTFTAKHEYLKVTMDRLCDIGDSNGVWDYSTSGAVHSFAPRTDGSTHNWQAYQSEITDEEESNVNRVILIGARVKDSDGVYEEIISYATDGQGYDDMVVTDNTIEAAADGAQKATNILTEYGTEQKLIEAGPHELDLSVSINDLVQVLNKSSASTETFRIYEIEHDLAAQETYVSAGNIRTISRTINVVSGYDSNAIYGAGNLVNLDTRRVDTYNYEENISASYDLTVSFNVQFEGAIKVLLSVEGAKYRQASNGTHTHDNSASYTFDAHTHEDGSLAGSSHSHDNSASYSGDSHNHSLSINATAIPTSAHTHTINHGHSDTFSISSMTGSTQSAGSHAHEVLGVYTDTESDHSHSMPHTHTLSGSVTSYSGNSGGASSTLTRYTFSGSLPTGSESVSISGSSGGSGVGVTGTTGSRGGSISGSSGSSSPGALMNEDTYPSGVTVEVDETDRTTALWGGSQSNGFSQLSKAITTWASTQGSHELTFTSTQNGRLKIKVEVLY